MKQETKVLFVKMVDGWNQFNPQKAVKASFDENEFNKGCWTLDIALDGVVGSDFLCFLLPALQVHNCVWFLNGFRDNVILHIQ